MKKSNWLGVLAVTLVFGMTAVGCDDGTTDDNGEPQTVEYKSTDADGNTYILTITENTSRTAYIAVSGDSYVLIIRKAGQPDKVSKGIVSTAGAGGILTLLPNNSGSYTFSVTINVSGQMTNITGTIAIEGGESATAPGAVTPGGGLETLAGTVAISPSADVTTGTELTAAYSGSETVSYQWNKDGTAVTGATTNKYTPTEAGTYTVTASAAGYNSKTSPAVTVTLPALTGTVSITGLAEAGQTLTANTDSLTGSGAISYQWKRGGSEIGTDSSTYTVQTADIGATITVTVTRAGYLGNITSAPTAAVEAPPTQGLAYTLINDGTAYSVARGTATDAEVVIPAVYEGKPVTQITPRGFSGYTNITSVKIPNSVTNIGAQAFMGCYGLTSITIPDGVTSIGNLAFLLSMSHDRWNSSMTSVTIPASVTSIGDDAFGNLTSITFQGTIPAANLGNPVANVVPMEYNGSNGISWGPAGDLRAKYLARGIGTYTTTAPVSFDSVWTKQ